MNQFLTFFGSYYYPNGGMEDFSEDCPTLESAIKHLNALAEKEKANVDWLSWEYKWGHIYDTEKREIVWKSPKI
jgi:hypothetical protein